MKIKLLDHEGCVLSPCWEEIALRLAIKQESEVPSRMCSDVVL